jgi:hypothetical protein
MVLGGMVKEGKGLMWKKGGKLVSDFPIIEGNYALRGIREAYSGNGYPGW